MDKHNKTEKLSFHWPDKAVFEAEKQKCLQENHSTTIDQLRVIGIDDEIIEKVAETLIRVGYVFEFLKENGPIPLNIPVKLVWERNYSEDSNTKANTDPVYVFKDKEIHSFKELSAAVKDDQLVDLDRIVIHMNFPYVLKRLLGHESMYKRLVDWHKENYPDDEFDPRAGVDDDEESDIQALEAAIVEEWAHSLYIQEKSEEPDKLRKLVSELSRYNNEFTDDVERVMGIAFPTEEQMEEHHSSYTDTPIELRAAFWVRKFLKNYYPESNMSREEEAGRKKQKNRLQKRRSRS